jgi:magnesium-protoporphyrin IX monomethyl ester (oxidative) cyclase
MKVVLINPPQIFSQYQVGIGVTPPLGIAYLAAYCLKWGIDVEIVDSVGEAPDTVAPFREEIFLRGLRIGDIVERISQDVGLIGISNLFSFAYPAVRELANAIRAAHPDKPVVLGGAHPTHMYAEVLEHGSANFVVIGEGEIPLLELCRNLGGEIALEDVPSLAYRDGNGQVQETDIAPRIKDLDSQNIPYPARHLLPMENYIAAQEAHGATSGRWTSLITSRGCPYGCTFCDIRRTKWVARSARDVVDEMELCYGQWGIKEFHFEDDNMTLRRERLFEICDEIINRGLRIKWQTPNGIRASVTDELMLRKMKESGCIHITLAPESGSERVIREIIQKGKDYSHEQLLEIGRAAHKMGMKVAAYFILGMPGEKPEDVQQTIGYAKRLAKAGVDEAGFQLLIPLPGTPVWEHVVEEYGQPDYLDLLVVGDLNKAVSWSPHLAAEQLSSYRRRAYMTFQFYRAVYHPRSFVRTILNVLRGMAETKTENYMRMFIKHLRLSWRRATPKSGRFSGRAELAGYTPYAGERSVFVLLQTTAHYAFSNSGLKAALMVLRDFGSWLRGMRLPKKVAK